MKIPTGHKQIKLSAFQFGDTAVSNHFRRKRQAMWREHAVGALLKIYCFEISLLLGLLCVCAIMVFRFPVVLIAPPILYLYANLGELRKKLHVRKFWALDVYNPSIYTELAEKLSSEEIIAAAWKESMRKFRLMCAAMIGIAALIVLATALTPEPRFVWWRKAHPLFQELREDRSAAMMLLGLLGICALVFLRNCYLSWKSLFIYEAIPENVYGSRPRVLVYCSLLIFLTFFIISAIDAENWPDAISLITLRNVGIFLGALLAHQIFQHYLIGQRMKKLRDACPDLNIS